MSEAVQIALLTAVVNGAVTWGVMTTKLAWLRRDVDLLLAWQSRHECRSETR